MDESKPVALVTGASAGLGAAFARRLARDGYRLILVARRRDRLEELARELPDATVVVADLGDDAGVRLVEEQIAAEPRLSLLVNNAGFGTKGRFYEASLESQEQMHRVHVMATMRLTHAALRAMIPRNRGAVINVASVAGFAASPQNASYCATKAWMNFFTEGVSLDLKSAGSAVQMQSLCPGFTVTEFHDVMQMDRNKIPSWLWMTAEEVVDASLKGLQQGKLYVVPGAIYKAVVQLEKWMPVKLRGAMVMRYAKKTKRI